MAAERRPPAVSALVVAWELGWRDLRARRRLSAVMLLRSLVFMGDRRKASFAAARWLSRSSARELLEPGHA